MRTDRSANRRPDTAWEFRMWLERALLAGVLLAGAVAMSANIADPDLWGHVQYGRDLLQHGLPATTTYSFTAEGYRWINHENLAEVLLACGANLIGPNGLLLAKCLLGVGVLALIMGHAQRRGVNVMVQGLVALLVAVSLAPHWSLRPQLLTYAFYTLMLCLLTWCFQGWDGHWRMRLFRRAASPDADRLVYSTRRLRFLWLAPILFLVWANSHGGFVAGYCIFSAYLLLRACEALTCRGKAALGLAGRLAMMVAAAGLATLINPYGPALHGWLLTSLSIPRPEITEWHPPALDGPGAVPLALVAATWAIALVFTRRRRDFTHLVLLSITLWQTTQHARHLPFFAIAFGFWVPVHLESVLHRFRKSGQDTSDVFLTSRAARWGVAVTMCIAYAFLGGKLYQRLTDMPVPRDQFPVSAVEFMGEQDLRGRLVVTYNWAQYLIAAFGTDDAEAGGIRVAFDGRFRTCYPQNVVDMHFDLVLGDLGNGFRYRGPDSPPFDPYRVLEHGRPDLVLINRFQPHSEQCMRDRRAEWVLLYQDKISQLWGRRNKYDRPERPEYVTPSARQLEEVEQIGSVSWPALPSRRENSNAAHDIANLADTLHLLRGW